jgi:hypothetical protein
VSSGAIGAQRELAAALLRLRAAQLGGAPRSQPRRLVMRVFSRLTAAGHDSAGDAA